MKNRWFRVVALCLLAVTVCAAAISTGASAATDFSQPCSLTVIPGVFEDNDLDNANVQIDLYKIADAVPDPVYDAFTFSLAKGVKLSAPIDTYEHLAALDVDTWRTLAQDAAKFVLDKNKTPIKPETDHSSLDSGLYLVVAHGAGLDKKQYVTENKDGQICTIAYSLRYEYRWLPELIVLPSRTENIGPDQEEGSANTAYGDEWKFDVTATLKPERDPRYGDLLIHKTISLYEDSSPVTVVFHIVATLDGEVVYDDIAALTFTADGLKTAVIAGKIPAGAEVTVTEVYSGAGFVIEGSAIAETVILPPTDENGKPLDPASVSFKNKYDENTRHGYGILNTFTYSDEDGWQLENTKDSSGK